MERLLIKGGHIVDPVLGLERDEDVLIEDGLISRVEKDIKCEDCQLIDATGLVVAPGLVDSHVHFRDPGFTYKEDIYSGARAGLRGGFTSVICMANTKPAVDNPETLKYILDKGKETGIHLYQCSTVTKSMAGKELVDMEVMVENGAVGFTDDGLPLMDENVLLEALKKAKELNMPVSLHEEDPNFVFQAGVNRGRVSEELNYGGADRTAEDIMVARDGVLALHTGARMCIQHISSANSVELLRLYKKLGADIHGEATPHHFSLTEDAVLEYKTMARMNPPLREEADRRAIIEGIKDGTIDMIVTDHAPHSSEEKARELGKAPSGITGLETSLGLGIRFLVKAGHISLMKLMECMSKNPMEFYNLKPISISDGNVADIVIFDPDQCWRVDDFASKAANSPFKGWELPGKIFYTISKGDIVYKG